MTMLFRMSKSVSCGASPVFPTFDRLFENEWLFENECRPSSGHLPTFIPERDAVRLDEWLIARGLEEQKSTFTRREIQRNGTTETRDQTALEPALRHLEQRSRVRVRQVNKTVTIEINRRLLDQSATQME
jgi:hypothetical protein